MFQIEIDEKFKDYDCKTVKVFGKDGKITVTSLTDVTDVLFSVDMPEDLKKTFDFIPEKRGYIKQDEKGNVYFTLIRFADYHLHSEFSLLDGANKIKTIAEKSEGCSAVTDHGVMFGSLQLFEAMDNVYKKPLVGIEAYSETKNGHKDGCHLILLIKNEIGWKNICKLISEAEVNFYKKPHLSYDMLEKYHEGLICTSACIGGELGQEILANNIDGAMESAEILLSIFGEDFYIELQNHHMGSEEEAVNNALFDIAAINNIKIVGAIDAHYTDKEDKYAHEILLCIGTKKKMSDVDRFTFDGDGYYMHTADEFEELFKDYPELISNTFDIIDKCNFRFDLKTKNMPKFKVPEGFSSEIEYFEHQCREGFEFRFGNDDPRHDDSEYIERFNYEIGQIEKTGFAGYFLIVQDYVIWAKENGIYVGPGRGSCVGSLVCFCLRITELDPIPYGLLFERFINPERISPPDIDMDFEDIRREEVVEYIRRKYGEDHVSHIITFGTMAARNIIRDVGRVLEKDSTLVDQLAKAVPVEVHMTLEKALKVSPDFKSLYNSNADAKEIIDIAQKLEGLSRQKSIHACGVIVANEAINNFVPEVLMDDKETKGKKVRVAAFNMVELENLGLLKMDFLGLRNMTIEKYAVNSINSRLNSEE